MGDRLDLHHRRRRGPAHLGPSAASSGYRYYSADQIPTAQVIHRLRDLDVPLADVRRIPGASVAGLVRERYLVGPRDTDDSAAWRTDLP